MQNTGMKTDVRQGTEGRGKEIYDPGSDAWYWLDAADNGKMAVSKDVYQESNGGKWVRYDENGHMIKGWNTNDNGTYYFDLTTGAMYKGKVIIDGVSCVFDDNTGIGVDCKWLEFDGVKYWYEGGRRQGLEWIVEKRFLIRRRMHGTGWMPSTAVRWQLIRMCIRNGRWQMGSLRCQRSYGKR